MTATLVLIWNGLRDHVAFFAVGNHCNGYILLFAHFPILGGRLWLCAQVSLTVPLISWFASNITAPFSVRANDPKVRNVKISRWQWINTECASLPYQSFLLVLPLSLYPFSSFTPPPEWCVPRSLLPLWGFRWRGQRCDKGEQMPPVL